MHDHIEDTIIPIVFGLCFACLTLFLLSLTVWGWLDVFGVIEMP